MSKGQAEASEVIFIVAAIAISIVLMLLIFQKVIGDIQIMTSLSSADALSKNVKSIVTAGSAAPGDLKVTYQAPEGTSYNLNIQDKNINLEKLGEGGRTVESSVYGIAQDMQVNLQNVHTLTFVKTQNEFQIEAV